MTSGPSNVHVESTRARTQSTVHAVIRRAWIARHFRAIDAVEGVPASPADIGASRETIGRGWLAHP